MPTITAPTRIKLHNILFATDFSSAEQAGLPHAIDLARRYGGVLYTAHVLPHWQFFEAAQTNPEEARLLVNQQMHDLTSSASFKDVEHKELIEQGEVAEELLRLVHKHAIDLIVIGTGGRKGPGKMLLGSVAESLFRNAECPVLTIGPHSTRWGIDGNLRHILFATDFRPESLRALPYALSLAEENRARLTLWYASQFPLTLPEFRPEDPRERLAHWKNRLRALIPKETLLWHEPEYLVQFGRHPGGMIVKIAEQSVDMIVLGAKRKRPTVWTKHLGVGVAYKVVCEAPCPVLTVGAARHLRCAHR
jgi:nucleotide-binding universal stress UspA family protein